MDGMASEQDADIRLIVRKIETCSPLLAGQPQSQSQLYTYLSKVYGTNYLSSVIARLHGYSVPESRFASAYGSDRPRSGRESVRPASLAIKPVKSDLAAVQSPYRVPQVHLIQETFGCRIELAQ
ncbi:hypothetical protein Cob_v004571 [Colletotrichum orbiculare MAFF 240422]|uniref:Uncharacterized protein n=1 Tax=Colletotrichum orbiculare (strain 104-T / ATCC 96160 / CBS 514.97 / LARS 414 / MAFF 240422) TaxID=1213857 RepID=A0A484FZC6_COLOR|nr:hypothetical protein Cob_v004571 [Colletotrichum orbiculare MAFF 240422]